MYLYTKPIDIKKYNKKIMNKYLFTFKKDKISSILSNWRKHHKIFRQLIFVSTKKKITKQKRIIFQFLLQKKKDRGHSTI